MSRDFQFKQILRAYRMGIISEATLEQEMKVLENGAQASPNGNGAFKAFGQTYESERAAVMRFLEAVSAAETNGGDLVRAWLAICKTDCIRGGLKMVAEREGRRVLGVSMLGMEAAEVVHEAAMGIRLGAKVEDFVGMLHIYPTMSEALKIVALSFTRDVSKLSCCAE